MADVLSRIHSAVVLLDADAPGFPEAALDAAAFFRSRGIPLSVCAVRRRRWILPDMDAQLLISLVSRRNCLLSHKARRSRALFKAGRSQLRGEVFDLVVDAGPEYSQKEIFRRMIQIMEHIA